MELQVKESLKIKNIKADEVTGLQLIKLIESKVTVK